MITQKDTDIDQQLNKFRNEFYNLLSKYPNIRIAGDDAGDVLAYVPAEESPRTKVYLPRSGKQGMITQFALYK